MVRTHQDITRMLITDEDRILLLQRSLDSKFGAGKWCLPGGKISYPDEKPEDVVSREVLVETGINVLRMELLCKLVDFKDNIDYVTHYFKALGWDRSSQDLVYVLKYIRHFFKTCF